MRQAQPTPPFVARKVLRGTYLFHPTDRRYDSENLGIHCAGLEECSSEYEVAREGFPYVALEIIAGGEWELEFQGKRWTLNPGMVFAYGPGIPYSLRARSSRCLRKYFVDFTGENALGALHRAGVAVAKPARLAHPRWTQDIVDQLIDAGRLTVMHRRRITPLLAALLIERLHVDRETGGTKISVARQTFERCREHLVSTYLEINDLREAARVCGVTPVYLCRLFRRFAGETPGAFVRRMKMNHAAELIVRGHVAVKTAALEVGFDDQYYFSRVFKAVHGRPPSALRRFQ